jgi:hypothetical protein
MRVVNKQLQDCLIYLKLKYYIKNVFNPNKNYTKFSEINLEELKDAFLNVLDYKITFGAAVTILYKKYNLINTYPREILELENHGYQIIIILENKIKDFLI